MLCQRINCRYTKMGFVSGAGTVECSPGASFIIRNEMVINTNNVGIAVSSR